MKFNGFRGGKKKSYIDGDFRGALGYVTANKKNSTKLGRDKLAFIISREISRQN